MGGTGVFKVKTTELTNKGRSLLIVNLQLISYDPYQHLLHFNIEKSFIYKDKAI